MSQQPKFDYGETVQVTGKKNKGRIGLVVGIHERESCQAYIVKFEDGSEFEIADESLSECKNTIKLNVKAGLLFAALGFAIVVAIGILYLSLDITPATLLLHLAPAGFVFATEDVGWTELLVVVAPLNAALYGGIAFALTSALRHLLERHRAAISAQ